MSITVMDVRGRMVEQQIVDREGGGHGVAAGGACPTVTSELFTLPLEEDRFLIYAPLRRSAFVANSSTVRFLAALRGGSLNRDADPDGELLGLLRRLEIVDGGPQWQPAPSPTDAPQPVSISLLLTTACNLRCRYCYASGGDGPAEFMTMATAGRAIDFAVGNAVRRGVREIEVSYHGGGEPSRNWEVLVGSLDYARATAGGAGLSVNSYMATNGVLDDAQADWICRNLTGASVSLDGPPGVHDVNRVLPSGLGSSSAVIRTLRRFDEARFSYGIRATITEEHVARLPEIVDFIASRFHPEGIQVEPVYLLGRWKDGASAESTLFVEAFRRARRAAQRHGKELAFSAARVGTLTSHFCRGTQDAFCVAASGNVTACYEVFSERCPLAHKFFYGSPDPANGGYSFDLAVLAHLREQAVENRAFCADCFARWTCGGDCFHKALQTNGVLEFAGAGRCHITRELTKDLILEKIEAGGGLAWHDPLPADASTRLCTGIDDRRVDHG